uniref:hypothetical protein n=1 Tax=Micromonospora acroterricola TaxID=2202421 RepID=UPI00191BE165|nr:hypothetical protein [Micromonospora acroterricola]
MSGQLEEVLKHRYIYVPHGTKKDTIQPGKRLGLAVARASRPPDGRGTPQGLGDPPPRTRQLDIVAERSGHLQDGGVVLAWCPTYKVMEKSQRLERSVVVLVEWIHGEFDAWARLHGAYSVANGEVMDAGLTAEVSEALKGIVYEGYNGWTKSTDELMTLSFLKDLAAAGAYDRELVLAYARQSKSEHSIERLKKILDRFETSQRSLLTTPDSDFPTSPSW